jgi:colicin import membrane protein
MRPAEYKTEDIIKAGLDLQVLGRKVSGFSIREKLGGGNTNRFKKVWDEYQASQTGEKAEPPAELSTEIAEIYRVHKNSSNDQLLALVIEINDKAVKATERRIKEDSPSANDQRERELADALQTIDEREAEIDKLKVNAEELEKKFADMLADNQSLTTELANIQERFALAELTANRMNEQYAAELEKLQMVSFQSAPTLRNELIEQIQKTVTREEATIETGQLKTTEPTQVSNGQQTRNLSLGLNYTKDRNPFDFSPK